MWEAATADCREVSVSVCVFSDNWSLQEHFSSSLTVLRCDTVHKQTTINTCFYIYTAKWHVLVFHISTRSVKSNNNQVIVTSAPQGQKIHCEIVKITTCLGATPPSRRWGRVQLWHSCDKRKVSDLSIKLVHDKILKIEWHKFLVPDQTTSCRKSHSWLHMVLSGDAEITRSHLRLHFQITNLYNKKCAYTNNQRWHN